MVVRLSILLILFFIPAAVLAQTKYVVKKGDNLYDLSKKFGVSVRSIKKTNGLSTDRLDIGDAIIIPDSDGIKELLNQEDKKKPSERTKYTVVEGDTLIGIGKKLNVSAGEIKRANNLTTNKLRIGQSLIISSSDTKKAHAAKPTAEKKVPGVVEKEKPLDREPDPPSNSIKYRVKDGDSLGRIAARFGVSVRELKRTNALSSDELKVGMVLAIPSSSNIKETAAKTSSQSVFVPIRHVVQNGDNLYDLAERFNTSIEAIKQTNAMTSDKLIVGKVVLIPNPNGEALAANQEYEEKSNQEEEINKKAVTVKSYYVVAKGDTLIEISRKFGISVEDIKKANGLKGNKIRSGMKLKLTGTVLPSDAPKTLPDLSNAKTYKVKKGDTLGSIAVKFGVSVKDLKRANRIDGTKIRAGQSLSIPGLAEERNIYKTEIKTSPSVKANDDHSKERVNGHKPELYDADREGIISVAKRFLGAPYKFGGTSPIKGIDCSAFVNKVFSFFDVSLPRTARDIFKVGKQVDRDELATGDLVFFRTYAEFPSHVGIYIGDDEFIHASSKAKKVTIDSINKRYYRKRYIGAKRIEIEGLFYEELSRDYRGFEN